MKDRSPAARRALADKLLAEAAKTTDNPRDRFVLLVGACDAASEGGDLQLARTAATSAANFYKLNAEQLAASAALKLQFKALPPSIASEAVEETLKLENEIAQEGDLTTAGQLLASLQSVAGRSPRLAALARERAKQLSEMRESREQAEAAIEKLKKNPDDPSANSTLGEYFCFDRGDFERGLHFLTRSNNAELRSAASLDFGGASAVNQQIAIGDAWWNLAERAGIRERFKAEMRRRASFWYRKALDSGDLTGLRRTIAEKRIAEISGESKFVYLSALNETRVDGIVVTDLWGLAKDEMNPGHKNTVTVNGIRYAHALGFNPNDNSTVHIDYALNGQYRRFTGGVGIDDSAAPFPATLTFKIMADGREAWRSHPFRQGKLIEKFDVSLLNVKTLELQVVCAGVQYMAHCVWVEPRLEIR